MAQDKKLQKLELTWIGKDDSREPIEPRILIENPDYSYGTVETGTLPNGKPWNGNMLIHGDNLLALNALEENYTGAVNLYRSSLQYGQCVRTLRRWSGTLRLVVINARAPYNIEKAFIR